MESKPFVITIVGPESSGKTTLARQLAAEIGCPWVPEYAREYLEGRGGYYDERDLLEIAEEQLSVISNQLSVISNQSAVGSQQSTIGSQQPAVSSRKVLSEVLQRNMEKNNALAFYREDFGHDPRPVVIIDSGMMGMRVWAKLKYKMAIPLVDEALNEDITSMYILCRPVLPWEADPLREASSLLDRSWIYNHYLQEVFSNPAK